MQHQTRVELSPRVYDAVIFDLDGVVTQTAAVHGAAWKKLFDEYLQERTRRDGHAYAPFDIDADYRRYVDGKPRYEGVRSFLASRDIEIPYGNPEDDPETETICGLGNRKNEIFHRHLRREGVKVYDSSISLIKQLKADGFKTAVVSSSKNCEAVLKAARAEDLFDAKVDGLDQARLQLKGKPNPDIFLAAAWQLDTDPQRAVVVEEAIDGDKAGHRGHFGLVIGVDRVGHGDQLKQGGADVVVKDLAQIEIMNGPSGGNYHDLPSAF